MITSNLFTALLCLSTASNMAVTGYLRRIEIARFGIDGMSINQDDVQEKELQVPLMKRIYTQSKGTIAYIGSPKKTTSAEGVKAMFRMLGSAPISGGPGRQLTEMTFNIHAAHDIFSQPFFNRSWVIQEMVLSQEVICLYGAKGDWQTWGLAVWLAMAQYAPAQTIRTVHNLPRGDQWDGEDIAKLSQQIWNMSEFNNIKRDHLNNPTGINPVKAASAARMFEAGDPMDKVYSLLGLFSDEDASRIKVDYTATTARVFTDFAKACVSAGYAIDLLERSRIASKIGDLPSWVPDWTWMPSSALHGKYNCANHVAPQISLLEGDRLKVRGMQLDVVEEAGPKCENDRKKGEAIQFVDLGKTHSSAEFTLMAVVFAEAMCKKIVGDDGLIHGQPMHDVIWQSLLVGYSCFHQRRCIPEDREYYDAFNKIYERNASINKNIIDKLQAQGEDTEDLIDMSGTFASIVHHLDGRALCNTKSKMFSILPNEAAAGDLIIVVLGATTPYLLRKVGDSNSGEYKMLGPCYVHGWMEGELWDSESGVKDFVQIGPEMDFIIA